MFLMLSRITRCMCSSLHVDMCACVCMCVGEDCVQGLLRAASSNDNWESVTTEKVSMEESVDTDATQWEA